MFSTTSKYALRALAYLSAQKPDRMVPGEELSLKTGVPRNYLSKILLALGNAGIVTAVRGAAGGYRLGVRPEEVPLNRVIGLFDRTATKRACLLGLRPFCSGKNPCTAHHAWMPAKTAFFTFLESTTLRDISLSGRPGRAGKGTGAGRRSRPKATAVEE